jgi:hypothetical protein
MNAVTVHPPLYSKVVGRPKKIFKREEERWSKIHCKGMHDYALL